MIRILFKEDHCGYLWKIYWRREHSRNMRTVVELREDGVSEKKVGMERETWNKDII